MPSHKPLRFKRHTHTHTREHRGILNPDKLRRAKLIVKGHIPDSQNRKQVRDMDQHTLESIGIQAHLIVGTFPVRELKSANKLFLLKCLHHTVNE